MVAVDVSKINPRKFVLFVIGTTGDVNPMINLAQALKSHGHSCTVATHQEFESKVLDSGINFAPLAGNPEDLMDFSVSNGLFTLSFFGTIASNITKYFKWIEELFDSALLAAKDADVIIESPICMIGRHIAEKLGVPILRTVPFSWAYTLKFPHPLLFSNTKNEYKIKTGYKFLSKSWSFMLRSTINKCRKRVGLPPVKKVELGLNAKTDIPIIHTFSQSFVERPLEWKDNIHLTGYLFPSENPSNYVPPPTVKAFIEWASSSPKPLVYIGFGSVIVSDPGKVMRDIIEAVEIAGVNAVFAVGWLQRKKITNEYESNIEFPSNILVVDSIPHSYIFPHVQAVIHHGGAGTTAAGLKCGKPTIIKPFFGDQRFWGEQVERRQVGLLLSSLEAYSLANAIISVLTDEQFLLNAMKVALHLHLEDGPKNAVDKIMLELEKKQKN